MTDSIDRLATSVRVNPVDWPATSGLTQLTGQPIMAWVAYSEWLTLVYDTPTHRTTRATPHQRKTISTLPDSAVFDTQGREQPHSR